MQIKRLLLLLLCFAMLSSAAHAEVVITPISSSNANNLWVVENTTLPIVAVTMSFSNAGAAYDPEGKAGTAHFLATMLTKGAGDYSNLAFNEALEAHGIRLGFSVDKDNFYVQMKTLRGHLDTAWELMMLALTEPRLAEKDIDITRKQQITGIAQSMERPAYIASIAWYEQYFDSHPYANPTRGTEDTVSHITKDDLVTFLATHLARENLDISIVGDISESQAKSLVQTHLAKLPKNHGHKKLPAPNNHYGKKHTITMDIPQSTAVFGSKGVPYLDPDFYPAYIMIYILGGGGFESRFMQEIREKRGLAYSVYSYLDVFDKTPLWAGMVSTRSDAIHTSLELIKLEMLRLKEEGISQQEFIAAKNYITGSFPLKFDSNHKLASMLNFMQRERLGIDFLNQRNEKVRAVMIEQVNDVAKRLLDPEKLSIVVVGKPTSE